MSVQAGPSFLDGPLAATLSNKELPSKRQKLNQICFGPSLTLSTTYFATSSAVPPTTEATFARAVDVRRYVNVPATYTGIVQNMTYTTYQLQKLVAVPLGEIASALRVALDPKTTILPFHTRALATYLHSQADKSMVSPASSIDLSVDVMLSSWPKTDCYGLDFNLRLGFPEAVRRPRFAPLQSFVYFMPRACDGEIAVAICLREEDMERLKVDEEFVKYARHHG